MAQPSVANYFSTRKRAASSVNDAKIIQARKVLILDSSLSVKEANLKGDLEIDKAIIFTQVPSHPVQLNEDDCPKKEKLKKLQEKEEKILFSNNNKVLTINTGGKLSVKKGARTIRSKKVMKSINNNNNDIQELFNKLTKKQPSPQEEPSNNKPDTIIEQEECYKTPPSTPKKSENAMDKVRTDGPSLKEIKSKLTRSSRLADLKASIARVRECDKKLKEIEKVTSQIPDHQHQQESPKLNKFKSIELEVATSPRKLFSPEKAYLSPRKEQQSSGVRKNLLNLLTPTKNRVSSIPDALSPSKALLSETSKSALTLPAKYRFLAEIFRSVDTVVQILFNRKESITFRKLKPAVEEMLKRNLMEKHLAQIKAIYPDAFRFSQEKLKIYGQGMRAERWELVIQPQIEGETMSSELLLERRRKLFNILMDKVKQYHGEFLETLDTPICIPKDKVTRWHPEFDIEKVPDIELSSLPQSPNEDKLTSGKDVLEKARVLFSCNTKMENAMKKLSETKEIQTNLPITDPPTTQLSKSILKGIPKDLLEKVRQRQAAKALISMTRTTDKEKEVQLYSRLPELARLARNLFVAEKKGVLTLDNVVEKLGNSYRGNNLNKSELEEHLKIIAKELPNWLQFHTIRNCVFVKLNKNADLSLVLNKFEGLCKLKNES